MMLKGNSQIMLELLCNSRASVAMTIIALVTEGAALRLSGLCVYGGVSAGRCSLTVYSSNFYCA